MDTLSVNGRRVRVAITAIIAALLLYGTIAGQDDMFPFGPFRMYATADKLDAPVPDTRWEGVQADGTVVQLNQGTTGVRRAEIEGQLGRIEADPSLLHAIDEAYMRRNPHAPELVQLRIVIRWHALHGGKPTGAYTDQTVATWSPP
jgi:hypothetical protein